MVFESLLSESQHMKTINDVNDTFPEPLTPERERELLTTKADEESRNLLLLHNMREAVRYGCAVAHWCLPVCEIVSLAAEALIRSIERYTFREGQPPKPLINYARACIRGRVVEAWRFRNPVEPGGVVTESLYADQSEDPSEIAMQREDGLDECANPEFGAIDVRERMEIIQPHFTKLRESEKRILILLYESRLTGADIARMLGCSRANIRETRVRALRKIRQGLMREKKYSSV